MPTMDMQTVEAKDKAEQEFDLVIGMGTTGLSVIRYLNNQGRCLRVLDTREHAPAVDLLRERYSSLPVKTGGWDPAWLKQAERIIVSPGVSINTVPLVDVVRSNAEKVMGDIELFAQAVESPVVAITGSNAKSTVTALVDRCARAAGIQSVACGNIGTPALTALEQDASLYALELSSFQLETTHTLKADVATILNLSEDHMDRYEGMQGYRAAKQRIYSGARVAVWNLDEPETRPDQYVEREVTFGAASGADYWFDQKTGNLQANGKVLTNASRLKISGIHNALNVLAVMAICDALEIDQQKVVETIEAFDGLEHRCQLVCEHAGVKWINDSKGTNVGATLAALNGIGGDLQRGHDEGGSTGKIILLAGGVSKSQDFSPLVDSVQKYVRSVLLFGIDAEVISGQLSAATCTEKTGTLGRAIKRAQQIAQPGDVVLLSPACASFDQFSGYQERGERFIKWVSEEVKHEK